MFRKLFLGVCFTLLTSIFCLVASPAFAKDKGEKGDLLEKVKKRGFVLCGVQSANLPGFAVQLPNGEWSGHDIDYCRTMAAAIFGDETAVEFVRATASNRLELLRNGEFDLLVRNTTNTLSRDADGGEGVDFAPTIFYDGQGFLSDVTGGADLTTTEELATALDEQTVCVTPNTTTQLNLRDFASDNGIDITELATLNLIDEYNGENCNFVTADRSFLISLLGLVDRPGSIVFSKTISKEPLAPVVRMEGKSERFEDVVRWVTYATFFAEERGINMGNVEDRRDDPSSLNSEEKRLLGVEGDLGVKLGLDNDWAFDVIRLVGSHEDIYQRNLSDPPPGDNQPPPNGLLYSPPFR